MAGPRIDAFRRRALLAGLALSAGAANAQWGGAIGYGTDNVYRGVSLSSGQPAWLADLHYRGDGWTAGFGASQERPPFQSSGAQLTLYADRYWSLDDDWSAKVGVVHYESPWNVWRNELRYNDVTAAIGWRGRWRLSIALSPDMPGIFSYLGAQKGFAGSAELSYRQPIRGRLSANAGLGVAHLHVAGLSYRYGSAGLSYGVGDVYIYTSLLWSSPDALRYNTGARDQTRWVTSVVWSF
ncbi:MAG TPA: hypothetical protein VLF18_19430 [Tahibacter sp.]|uniref:hypothetical protein n=1 Tax=Tahibacter sp. TaxID=2056211 RepID=UPI002CD343F0|nr:hypothetical protein [Tahibacter sp.]HSX62362.1 hypothetical protein [Tahibacter sp.]